MSTHLDCIGARSELRKLRHPRAFGEARQKPAVQDITIRRIYPNDECLPSSETETKQDEKSSKLFDAIEDKLDKKKSFGCRAELSLRTAFNSQPQIYQRRYTQIGFSTPYFLFLEQRV